MEITNTFTTAETIVASEVNQNFSDIASALNGGLDTGSLADNAGIKSTQIADRYATFRDTIVLVPQNGVADTIIAIGTGGTLYAPPATLSDIWKHKIRLKSGQEGWICSIEWYVVEVGGSGGYPTVAAKLNSTTLAGSAQNLSSSDAYVLLANSDPLNNPLVSCQNGDVLTFQLGTSAGAGPKLRGLIVTVEYKVEVTS